MRKFVICIALAFVLVMGVSGTGLAGLVLQDPTYCNDNYLLCESRGNNTYGCNGHEYGCGYSDRLLSATLRVVSGYLYIGIWSTSGDSGSGDYGNMGFRNAVIDLTSKSGPYGYNYQYVSGGVIGGHGSTGTYDMSSAVSAPPEVAEPSGPDQELQ